MLSTKIRDYLIVSERGRQGDAAAATCRRRLELQHPPAATGGGSERCCHLSPPAVTAVCAVGRPV